MNHNFMTGLNWLNLLDDENKLASDLLPLLSLVCPAAPEVFVPHAEAGDVLLQVLLLLLAVDAGEVHPVVPTVLLSLVPVGLKFSLNFSFILVSYLPWRIFLYNIPSHRVFEVAWKMDHLNSELRLAPLKQRKCVENSKYWYRIYD